MIEGERRIDVPVLREIQRIYPSLPPAERRIADTMLADPWAILTRTSSEIASRAAASQPATSRLCSRLPTRTFAAFKVRLAQELGVDGRGVTEDAEHAVGRNGDLDERQTASDPLLAAIIERTERDLAVALRSVAMLDADVLRAAADALRAASSVVVCGFDLSGSVAWRLASLLHRAGVRARSERDPYDMPWMDDLGDGDVLLLISYRGKLPQMLDTIRRVRARGAAIVVLTNEARTELGRLADIVLLTRAPAAPTTDEYVSGPALYVQLAAARALWLAVVEAT